MAVLIVKHDSIAPLLKQLAQYWRKPDDFTKVCARALMRDTQDFYAEKGSAFWGRIGGAFKDESLSGVARISVMGAQGAILLHKVNGGTVYPKPPKKNLAIPASSEAKAAGWPSHGKTPPLRLGAWGRDGKPHALVEADVVRKVRGRWMKESPAFRRIWYWLAKSAYHPPDPGALPDHRRTADAVLKAARARAAQAMKTGRPA